MSSEEFWDLTWDEYYAREDRFLEQERRWDERFGLIASTYINTKLKEGATPIRAGSFFGYDAEDPNEPAREMTVEESIAYARKMTTPKA
jgi:hypothetical protein